MNFLSSLWRNFEIPTNNLHESHGLIYSSSLYRSQEGVLNFLDAHLNRKEGANIVLNEIRINPKVSHIDLSHNTLEDIGVIHLVGGLRSLRAQGKGVHISILKLTSNQLTDVSFHVLVTNLLAASPHPPTLNWLFLNNNLIKLEHELALCLAASFSSTESELCSLSLTNNHLDTLGFSTFVSNLDLQYSALTKLHLNVCTLLPSSVPPLVSFLESPQSRGLNTLCLNGNLLGSAGVLRLQRTVVSRKNTSIFHLECSASSNTEGLPETELKVLAQLENENKILEEADSEKIVNWDTRLSMALEKNRNLCALVQASAFALIPLVRIICMAQPNTSTGGFRLMDLPAEIRVHIFRCAIFVPSQHVNPHLPSSLDNTSMECALTDRQLTKLVIYAENRHTLAQEIRKTRGEVQVIHPFGSFNRGNSTPTMTFAVEDMAKSWILRQIECDKFWG